MKPDRQPFRKYDSQDSDNRDNTFIALIEAKTPNPDPADGQVLSRERRGSEMERMRVSRAADKQATKSGECLG
ncbi:uncharacterized protein AKAW2_11534S [Aspergillus luchuensis]|uniref:ABC bile acid transporter n=1 Tax=Aspergillus kawachii TaxID=1069201 RepID=A0A146F149_ASPKA|nr:uncharacterized protein AKAW2_11534S [Aspergillus luchuensis]BCR94488.1 hypothetical protein AKAW2_11534S [Aspergillus luchuensis]BCS07085.1 hypothetical protein ALUC_11466S [Aspergillus luchuensis]GAT20024.1 ABC bile acid transporter [Aspergillus luchuensis]